MPKKINPSDIIGRKFSELEVKNYGHYCGKKHYYICQCDCGTLTIVRRDSLLSGNTTSCGCNRYKGGAISGAMITHGISRQPGRPSPIYKTWENMRNRCQNPKFKGWCYYGGRGIKVCEEWDNSFIEFYKYVMEELGPKPEGMWIDRINNDGDYEPGNIRWCTPRQSRLNQRR